MDINTSTQQINAKRKLVFTVILIFIPIVLLFLLEVGLRVFDYGTNLDLFSTSTNHPGYLEVNNDVASRFFTKNKGTDPSNDVFAAKKTGNTYRIFVMGCSTTRGFPYGIGTSFSRILNYRLQDVFPNKKIEVVNTSMAAINSYAQADFIDEIINQKPDAILIYTGHNEFYGALGAGSVENGGNIRWMKKLHLSLIQIRTYQLIQQIIAGFTNKTPANPTATLMERIAENKAIAYNSELYKHAIEEFRNNMSDVLKKAQQEGIPVLFGDLVSNIHDQKPFKSDTTPNQPNAGEVYLQAQELEAKGLLDSAKDLYYKAKDLDCIRFRASEDINKTIYEISSIYGAHVVSVKRAFEEKSPNKFIGNNLLTEHLHPNIDGYFLMADVFFNAMREHKLIENQWDTSLIKPSEAYRSNWGFTPLDSLVADITIKSLLAGWPFKPTNVVNRYIYEYKPKSLEDTFALMCVKYDNIYIEDKHEELAKLYFRKGNYQQAFDEYNSLIRSYPYVGDLYIEAEKYGSMASNYLGCIELLRTYPLLDSSFLINVKLGKLYQKVNSPDKALVCYNRAKKAMKETDSKELIFSSLYTAYADLKDQKNAQQTLNDLLKINPNFNPKSDLKKKEVIVIVNKDSKVLIDKAILLAKHKDFDAALKLLYQAQNIQETTFGNQMIGSVLFAKGDPKALDYILKAYYDTPKDPAILNNLVVLYSMRKNYKFAYKYVQELKAVANNTETAALEKEILGKLNSTN